jgi:hypothetical protein
MVLLALELLVVYPSSHVFHPSSLYHRVLSLSLPPPQPFSPGIIPLHPEQKNLW